MCLVLLDKWQFVIHLIATLLSQNKLIGLWVMENRFNSTKIFEIQVMSFTNLEHANSSTAHVERPTLFCFLLRHVINESPNWITPPEKDFPLSLFPSLYLRMLLKNFGFYHNVTFCIWFRASILTLFAINSCRFSGLWLYWDKYDITNTVSGANWICYI